VRGEEIKKGSEGLDNPDPTQARPDVLHGGVGKGYGKRYQQQGRASQMINPIEVRSIVVWHGERYAYWKLRFGYRMGVIRSFYLLWVARGLR